MVLEQGAVAEIGPEVDFLVRAPRLRIAIDRRTIVVAAQEIRSIRHPVDRIMLAQRPVDGKGIVEEGWIEPLDVETECSGAQIHFHVLWAMGQGPTCHTGRAYHASRRCGVGAARGFTAGSGEYSARGVTLPS